MLKNVSYKYNKKIKAISLTSGIFKSPEEDLKYILNILSELKKTKRYKNIPIGVSIIPTNSSNFQLKKLGVSEIKYNIECFDKNIFYKVCPNLNYNKTIKKLIEAVKIFGRGHVYTNIIIGIGETDSSIINGIKFFAKRGIIPNLRPVYQSKYRLEETFMHRPSKERLLYLYENHLKILKKYNLINIKPLSMCSICGGCDLTPQIDK